MEIILSTMNEDFGDESKIIDCEIHLLQPEARKQNFSAEKHEPVLHHIHNHEEYTEVRELLDLDTLLSSMNKNNIQHGIIMGLPWLNFELQRQNNVFIKDTVKDHPQKFRGMYIPNVEQIDREVEIINGLNEDVFLGVKLIPNWQNTHIDSTKLEPIIEAVRNRNLFLMIHTDHPTQSLSGDTPFRLLNFLKENQDIDVLAPHLGGLLCLYGLDPRIEPLLENVHFITSVSLTPKMVQFAARVNSDNLIFGTDFPFNHCHDQETVIDGIERLDISAETREKIYSRTATELFACDDW